MDRPIVQNVLNSFTMIPIADIQLLLNSNNIQISADDETNYQTARNLLLTRNLQTVPSISLIDWIIAYRVASAANVPRINISSVINASNEELLPLSQSLLLVNVDKERIFRILRFMGVLNDDMILLETMPPELMMLTMEYVPCKDLSLLCSILPQLCELNQFLQLMRRRVKEKIGVNSSNYDINKLRRLCKSERSRHISAGDAHSLILSGSGQVYSFGNNQNGQLGLGDNGQRLIPTLIPGINNIKHISAGYGYSLIVNSSGQVYSFGFNHSGQLGLGDFNDRNIPTVIPGTNDIVSIATKWNHSIILDENGSCFVFGNNYANKLGLEAILNNYDINSPRQIMELTDIIQVSIGHNHSLFLNSDGHVFGLGVSSNVTSPRQIDSLNNIISISAGEYYSLALDENGHVFIYYKESYPTRIMPGVNDIVQISVGGMYSMLLNKDGRVYVFGDNNDGQLGLGTNTNFDTSELVLIPTLFDIVEISAGKKHSLCLDKFGQIYTFGLNEFGQLGLGDTINRNVPTLSMII